MQRQSIGSIIILVFIAVGAATTVSAQSSRRFVIQIPFQFVITGRALPAGKYAVERFDPTKPNVLMLKNTKTGVVRLFITQHVEKDDGGKRSCLIFKIQNGEFQLFQLWTLLATFRFHIAEQVLRRLLAPLLLMLFGFII